MRKILKDKKAITLIALVITIVVLIILAAVAINLSLGNNGIFNRAKTAKEQYQNAEQYEQTETAKVTNRIDSEIAGSNRNSGASYTLLWEGKADTKNTKYSFKDGVGDIEDYDFILIEYSQNDNSRHSVTVSKDSITKNNSNDIALWGWADRYTLLHFTTTGFLIDSINGTKGGDNNYYYNYPRKIYGIKF